MALTMLVGVAVSDINPHTTDLNQVVEHFCQVPALELQPDLELSGTTLPPAILTISPGSVFLPAT